MEVPFVRDSQLESGVLNSTLKTPNSDRGNRERQTADISQVVSSQWAWGEPGLTAAGAGEVEGTEAGIERRFHN